MALTLTPFNTNLTSITLIPSADLAGGTAEEYRCQLNQSELQASAGTAGTDYQTFCQNYPGAVSNSTFALVLAGFQAWEDVNDLCNLLWDNEGQNLTFELLPRNDRPLGATNPSFVGECIALAPSVGGTANNWAQFSLNLTVIGKPTKAVALAQVEEAKAAIRERVAKSQQTDSNSGSYDYANAG